MKNMAFLHGKVNFSSLKNVARTPRWHAMKTNAERAQQRTEYTVHVRALVEGQQKAVRAYYGKEADKVLAKVEERNRQPEGTAVRFRIPFASEVAKIAAILALVLIPIKTMLIAPVQNLKDAIGNVLAQEPAGGPWGGYKIAPLQEWYKGKNGVMGWISPLAGTTTISTNILGITTTPLNLKQLGIEKFSENAKIVQAMEAKGYMYYIIMDVGMKGLVIARVSNEPDTAYYGAPLSINVWTISSDLVPPLPANYTFDKAEGNGIFALVTINAIVIITDKKGSIRNTMDPTEKYPLPINPKVNITRLGEVVVTASNWGKPYVVGISENGEVKTYDQPIAAVYSK